MLRKRNNMKPKKIGKNKYRCIKQGKEFTGGVCEASAFYYDNGFYYSFYTGREVKHVFNFSDVLEALYKYDRDFDLGSFEDEYSDKERRLILCIQNEIYLSENDILTVST